MRLQTFLAAMGILAISGWALAQENWPQWRGPAQNGVAEAKGLPLTWSATDHIVWKTPLPSWSGGSPVIWGNRIFVTSPSQSQPASEAQQGRPRRTDSGDERDPGGSKLLLICLAKGDGAILWERELDEGNKLSRKQNDSSPSPVTDGQHVWVVTGTGAVTAFDMDGTQIWQRNLQKDYGAFGQMFGYGSSPVLHDGKLIIQVLHGYTTDAPSYLLAFDALTGQERWRVERPTDAVDESPDAYTTPALLRFEDKVQVVVSGGDYVTGHDVDSGNELWRAAGLNPKASRNWRVIASPVAVDGMVYAPSRKKPLLALRAGGVGDVTQTHRAWTWDKAGGPDVPTPACDGRYLYMVEDRGKVTCLDGKSGKVLWGPERTAPGTVSASPMLADGKLYVINEEAVTSVLAAGPVFKVLATNELDGTYTLSSPAVAGSQLFIRTATHLYCIAH